MDRIDTSGFSILVNFFMVMITVSGGILLAAIYARKGGPGSGNASAPDEETQLVQELHKGFTRMGERVESLEMLWTDKADSARADTHGK